MFLDRFCAAFTQVDFGLLSIVLLCFGVMLWRKRKVVSVLAMGATCFAIFCGTFLQLCGYLKIRANPVFHYQMEAYVYKAAHRHILQETIYWVLLDLILGLGAWIISSESKPNRNLVGRRFLWKTAGAFALLGFLLGAHEILLDLVFRAFL